MYTRIKRRLYIKDGEKNYFKIRAEDILRLLHSTFSIPRILLQIRVGNNIIGRKRIEI